MTSLVIARGPENGLFIRFLLAHGAVSMNDGGCLVHGGARLCPAIEYNQPIDVIKKMIPKTQFLISPLLMAIDHMRADAVEVLLPEDHARRKQVGMEDYLQEPLKSRAENKRQTSAQGEDIITALSSLMKKAKRTEPKQQIGQFGMKRDPARPRSADPIREKDCGRDSTSHSVISLTVCRYSTTPYNQPRPRASSVASNASSRNRSLRGNRELEQDYKSPEFVRPRSGSGSDVS